MFINQIMFVTLAFNRDLALISTLRLFQNGTVFSDTMLFALMIQWNSIPHSIFQSYISNWPVSCQTSWFAQVNYCVHGACPGLWNWEVGSI